MSRLWIIPVLFLLLAPGALAWSACGDYEGAFTYTGAFPGASYCSNYTGTDTTYHGVWYANPGETLLSPTWSYCFTYPNSTLTYIKVHAINGSSTCTHRSDTYNLYVGTLEPIANFTASPVSGTVPLTVTFTDASQNVTGGETWNWSVSPAPGVTINTPAAQNTVMTFGTTGNYTITHGMSNFYGSSIKTRTDYIYVYNSTATTTTYFYTYNAVSGYEIHNSNIYLQDVENVSWINSTPDADGRLGITTLGSHHVNAYATATGFDDVDLLNQLSDGGSYPLIMYPHNATNVSAGQVTLYVSVVDTWSPGTPVEGAIVNLAYDTGGGQFNDYRTTNAAGLVSFTVPNQTLVYVYAEKAGYTPGGSTVNSGTGNGGSASVSTIVYITQTEVTPTATITTLPGGGYPTVPVTVDPYPCVGDGSYQDTLNCQRKQTEMGADVIAWAPELIQLFILVTIIGAIKIIGK